MNELIKFGGYPVEMRVVGEEVLIQCKNVIGTYTQAKAFIKKSNITNTYQFGTKTADPAFITEIPGGLIKIACLEDTRKQFNLLYEKCEELLNI